MTKTLRELLEETTWQIVLPDLAPAGGEETEKALDTIVSDITNDSRKIHEGSLFFCIAGANSNGHAYAQQAAEAGASVLIIQEPVEITAEHRPVLVKVEDTRLAMAQLSAAWYGHPAREMKTIGVTGTKGKTTTTYLIRSILETAGKKTGLIGTIETRFHDAQGNEIVRPASNTTPESIVLQKTFREMADAGVEYVVMEVSSQALMLHRTQGFIFDLGIFTNLSPDHIGPNEHDSFENYLYCKSLLFRQCRTGIINGDDPYAQAVTKDAVCSLLHYGFGEENDLRARDLQLVHTPGELGITFRTEGLVTMQAHIPTPGRFSVYNALCAIAVCAQFDVPAEEIRQALTGARTRGRIEMVRVSSRFTLMIDYAHNAVALESLLSTLREYQPHRLVTVFGCGGNRSKLRRFDMGEVSGRLSDLTIITSDNPRFEEPEDIIADIVTGISRTDGKHIEITDRKEAIRYAILNGEPGDIIVLAGKGHEDYQEIRGVKYPMDERVLIREIMEEEGISPDAEN